MDVNRQVTAGGKSDVYIYNNGNLTQIAAVNLEKPLNYISDH